MNGINTDDATLKLHERNRKIKMISNCTKNDSPWSCMPTSVTQEKII